MKVMRSKSLGMYFFQNPKNEIERQYNKEILLKAEIIRCKQIKSLINEEFNFYDSKKMNSDFLAYFRLVANKKSQSQMLAYFHFKKFVNNKCTFNDLSIKLCENYRKYLLNSYQIKHPSFKIKRNTAAGYFLILEPC